MDSAIWTNAAFRLALEASPSGQLIVDKQGIILHINEKISDIFGYSREELVEQSLEILIPENYRQQHPDYRNAFYKQPTVRSMGSEKILYGLHKNGNKIPVEIGLNPLEDHGTRYVLASVVDISERLRAEQRFQLALEASPSGILLINSQGEIVLVNSKIEEIFGYTRDELINQSISKLVPVNHQNQHPEFISQFLKQPQSRAMGIGRDLYGLCKNGHEVPLEIGLNPLDIEQESHVLASVVDITERKKAEIESASLNKQIQHAQRLESLGVLAAGTAHDFNNILQAISGNADLARIKLNSKTEIGSHLDKIIIACQRAADLTKKMLDYAGKGKMEYSRVNINILIEELSDLIISAIPRKIALKKFLTASLPEVEIDKSQVQQIILNLITNAYEAIGKDEGLITITTGISYETTESLKRYTAFDYLKEGRYVYIEVIDTGAGMSPDIVDNMFDPFFTTKFTGRGLGMAAVLGIIRSHFGSILINTIEDSGTQIKIIFPASEILENDKNDAISIQQTFHSSNTKKLDGCKALIIDDDTEISHNLKNMLEIKHLDITLFDSGRKALAHLEHIENSFDIILLDMNMPDMDGAEVYSELCKRNMDTKTILMSGYSKQKVNASIQEIAQKNDQHHYFLAKPFMHDSLIYIITQIIERSAYQQKNH